MIKNLTTESPLQSCRRTSPRALEELEVFVVQTPAKKHKFWGKNKHLIMSG